MNGKLTTFENIFDLLKEKGLGEWYYVDSETIGRNLATVLDEWVNNDKTYYFLLGKRYNFELK